MNLVKEFKIPMVILFGITTYLILNILNLRVVAIIVILGVTIIGSYQLFVDSFKELLNKHFALDYIAILAVLVSVFTGEYLVGAIIALMISSGITLENYGVSQARKNLTGLIDRIPDEVILWVNNSAGGKEKISKIKPGQKIFLRKGEVISLDGVLDSDVGIIDESSLTGEPYGVEKIKGDQMRSGTINIGEPIVIKVTKSEKNSAYTKIVEMVKKAQVEKAPLVRLADRYSTYFTAITLLICVFAFIYSGGSLNKVLAVLVVATPCPLILATPIALIGGINAAAKKRIIVKKLASIEVLSRVKALIFDKTGTITLGTPKVIEFKVKNEKFKVGEILGIVGALERNSLHPLAKALVAFVKEKNAPITSASNIEEKIGVGISGLINDKRYLLSKIENSEGMEIGLYSQEKLIAIFKLEDQIKEASQDVIRNLKKLGYQLFIFTGDKKQAAEKVVEQLGENVEVRAELTPDGKQKGILELKQQKSVVAMVGDGINDAPALALADVGMVFSNEEQTAATDAADIVFLNGDFSSVNQILNISKKTINIAVQSILWGIGASIVAMILAALGLIPPIFGAGLQEVIDVAVILNALRTSRG